MGDKLKLFLFCESLSHGRGGAERIVTNLAFEMIKRGHLVCLGFDGSGAPAYQQHEDALFAPWNKSIPPYEYKNNLIEQGYDVFFVFYFARHIMNFFRLNAESKIPFGMQECSNPKRICLQTWRNTTGRIAHSSWERELIASAATRIRMVMPGYEKSFPQYIRQNTRAFPNSVPDVSNRATPAGNGLAPNKIIIIGGHKKNKNFLLLLEAFIKIEKEFPDWEIHNFGSPLKMDNAYHTVIMNKVASSQLKNRVFFHPATKDIFAEYAAAHIHAIPSLNEGCPTCVLEAMAHGLPSVGLASCPGTNELIKNGKNGLLVKDDITGGEMAQALTELMNSPHLRESLGNQALYDAKKYQAKDTYDQWEKMFYEMAAYKNDPERLLREQIAVDKERALHMARCRQKIFQQDYK
ncbi:glycosyltransferase [Desulfopila inferna]|uniref:glycosyltransferase n=1 Tax=Desulfopila inferna TaxID=468528 RepID=UPI001965D02F|nr:glycosyltransferase [Desulfopila inferna]MBM9602686.1 glycosyltransferase [Desulfopila inferna]